MKFCLTLLTLTVVWLLIGANSARAADVQVSNTVAVLDFTVEKPAADTGDWAAGLEDYFELA
jgi:hypothetical protein